MQGINRRVQIYNLLVEGHTPKRIQNILGCSLSLVWKHIRIYVSNKEIERLTLYPATFRKAQTIYTQVKPVEDLHRQIDIPCKFGASFKQIGKPPLQYGSDGKAHDKQATHHAIFGNPKGGKCVIWLKAGFMGQTPDEIIHNGNNTIRAIAENYMHQYGISLSYVRTYLDIEWIMVNMDAGKRISAYEGIKPGEKKEIAGAFHKQGDSSHPMHRQYQAVPKGDKEMPTEHARIDQYVYSGALATDIAGLAEREKNVMDILEKLTGAIQEIRQRMDLEAKK